jgi:hypothetical protein
MVMRVVRGQVEAAIVIGPAGEEIRTDVQGRIEVPCRSALEEAIVAWSSRGSPSRG